MYQFNAAKVRKDIVEWLRTLWYDEGMDHVVIGISGGKDSTVAAALCIEAFGEENVTGLLMPNGEQNDIHDSYRVCDALHLHYDVINIDSACKAVLKTVKPVSEEAAVNIPPRIRMTTLYAYAQSHHARVCGTGNLSERTLGYFTKWGDGASDFNPLGNLTSVEVVAIGDTYEQIPRDLIHKTPHDGLGNQSDEEKLGISYADVHTYLREDRNSLPASVFLNIMKRKTNTQHKRESIPMFSMQKSNLRHSEKGEDDN